MQGKQNGAFQNTPFLKNLVLFTYYRINSGKMQKKNSNSGNMPQPPKKGRRHRRPNKNLRPWW